MQPDQDLKFGDAMIVVDVQNDFCPGGALAVNEGDKAIPVLNRWIDSATKAGVPVIFSRDWHPVSHCSFKEQGGPWPPHCIQDTPGAAFHPDLQLPVEAVLVSKGTAFDRDAYSAFDGTGLAGYLRDRGVKRVWVGGLAMDVCVLETVKGARQFDFETHVIVSATRAVFPDKVRDALDEMRSLGAILEQSE